MPFVLPPAAPAETRAAQQRRALPAALPRLRRSVTIRRLLVAAFASVCSAPRQRSARESEA